MNRQARAGRSRRARYALLGLISIAGSAVVTAAFYALEQKTLFLGEVEYIASRAARGEIRAVLETVTEQREVRTPVYLETPEPLRAIYMTQCVAGTPSFRDKLIALAEETEVNAIVIDVKDFSGGLGFVSSDPELKANLSTRCFAPDMRELVERINEKGMYTIARVTVFQDPLFAHAHPEIAVQKASDKSIWKDHKGLSFVDAGAQEMWEYIVKVSREVHALGFDEINFDYIRFPSDGDMRDIYYPASEERVAADPAFGKAEVLREFFAYLDEELEGIVTSADIFGMTTTNRDDLNIGQVIEHALPYFDYVAPMVYPSHYPTGFIGLANPAAHPYEVIKFSMDSAVRRVEEMLWNASTTPNSKEAQVHTLQLRPWLQDFDLGAVYDVTKVRAQMQATYDAGLTSWMLWDPSNTYTRAALEETARTAPAGQP